MASRLVCRFFSRQALRLGDGEQSLRKLFQPRAVIPDAAKSAGALPKLWKHKAAFARGFTSRCVIDGYRASSRF
jgi:hypothetical protein